MRPLEDIRIFPKLWRLRSPCTANCGSRRCIHLWGEIESPASPVRGRPFRVDLPGGAEARENCEPIVTEFLSYSDARVEELSAGGAFGKAPGQED